MLGEKKKKLSIYDFEFVCQIKDKERWQLSAVNTEVYLSIERERGREMAVITSAVNTEVYLSNLSQFFKIL